MWILSLVVGCAPSLPSETELPPRGGRWGAVTLDGTTLSVDGVVVARGVHAEPAVSGANLAWASEAGIVVNERLRVPGVRADRLALSPDGAQLAYVAPANGLSSVWIVATEGGAPRQLTNVGLSPAKRGAPEGWVAPPRAGPPRFEGDRLRWDGGEVAWR